MLLLATIPAPPSKPSFLDRAGLRGPRMKYWFLYVAAFYVVWLLLVSVFGYWPHVKSHWPISVVMIFGSLVAGSTPMGGGTVAFPVLVLVFGQPPDIGRNFGLMIQALGMTSAMLFILCRGTKIQKGMLIWTGVGSAAGLVVGTFGVAPVVASTTVKLLFSCLWMSFAVLTLAKNREICSLDQNPAIGDTKAMHLGMAVGFAGGVTTSLIGVGVEMMLYTVLVLLFRCDLKIAVPSAVSAMAVASVLGIALHLAIGDVDAEVFYNWLAAGPIVVFGAPAGALLVSIIPRIRTLYFVSLLCVVQFVWTLYQVKPKPGEWMFVACSLLIAVGGFYLLYRLGRRAASPR
ncbi:MAG: sulfite exporter TauE/SafE family protein [Bryobacteraceae bacterium]